jgi:hypothetical protein
VPKDTGKQGSKGTKQKSVSQRTKEVVREYVISHANMLQIAEENFITFIVESIETLANRLKKLASDYINTLRNLFNAMLERASNTPRLGAGPEKEKLQQQVLKLLGETRSMMENLAMKQAHAHLNKDQPAKENESRVLGEHQYQDRDIGASGDSDNFEVDEFDFGDSIFMEHSTEV